MPLYPLKFKPRYLQKMWGGRKIETVLGKSIPNQPIGESWELYDFPPGVVDQSQDWISAEVANGPLAGKTLHELLDKFGPEIHGNIKLIEPAGQFPILIKFLDARDDLSVQVHPDQAYAANHPQAHLKNEAWYIVHADPAARLLKGLKKGVTRQALTAAIANGTVEDLIHAIPVEPGECFYLPSGTVHALGAGILAAEVQTPSDTTFRVYDFDRTDPATGKKRTLHLEEAIKCIHFSDEPQAPPVKAEGEIFPKTAPLVRSESFTISKTRLPKGSREPIRYHQPVVWIMLQGNALLQTANFQDLQATRGETILLPASMVDPTIESITDCVWLQVTFPEGRA